ncbi:pentapeptide repeat-containing protein [Desulfobacterales bacterium HSG2]|nr:pentapeptide repeat-containing protein [Desulfobacterales bacterium HSG2]
MAKKEHLDLIKQGVNAWNKWKANNPGERPDFSDANLCVSNLSYANFSQANFWEANLNKAKLWGVNFSGADLCFTDLSGTNMSRVNLRGANLTSADLSGADLRKADLRNAKLWGTNLSRTNLTKANLSRADLTEADLSQANLSQANCRGTNFNDTKLLKVKISHTDLSHADFSNADLSNAVVEWSTFGNVDLSMLKGLDTVRHSGPSVIGIDTTYRSRGNIPVPFLRGSGVPDNFINYMALLAGQPIRFYSCFISYAAEDRKFAQKLHADLRKKDVRCWLSGFGKVSSFEKAEPFRIPNSAVLLILSKNSITGDRIKKEIKAAYEEEVRRKKTLLFPLCLDSAAMDAKQEWGANLPPRHIGDFSRWEDPDAYKKSLGQLLREISGSFPKEKGKEESKPARKPPPPAPQRRIGAINFPEATYKIIGENDCPLFYKLGDELKLSGKSVLFPRDKSSCLILVEDIMEVHTKYESMGGSTGYAFKCSGCTGTIRLKYRELFGPETVKKPSEDTAALVSLLSNFSMFQSLDGDDIAYLITFLNFKQFSKDQIIMKKGEPGENLFIIVSGNIEVVGEGGISIAIMGRGEVFGEMSLLSGNPVGATIKAIEPVTLLYLNGKDFRKILNKFPSLQMFFTRLLANRLAEIHDVRSEEFASGMVGKLSEMPPSELFQTLNINQKTGVLTLKLPKGNAFLAFREGDLVRAEYSEKDGREAFYDMLKETEGRFKFTPGLSPEDMDADELEDFMWLLMEGTRKIDEEMNDG